MSLLSPTLEIEAIVFNPVSRKLIEKIPRRSANTLLAVWIKFLYGNMANTTSASVTDTGGTARTFAKAQVANAAAAATGYGIVVGNQVGPAAVTLTDTKLQAQVTTNVAHGAMGISLNAPDGTHYQLILQRTFTNNTGSTLAITEVGLYIQDAGTGYNYCADRTLMNITVNAGLATTLTYTWTTHT